MTTPDVPLRVELTVHMPGSREQVWEALATGKGISSWFLPTDLEARQGGRIVTHMPPGEAAHGKVTGWEPEERFAYEEPDWASFAGHEGAAVTPLVTEFLVDAKSGGTCVVRLVSSAFGTGADWEEEFFTEMEKGWQGAFHRLRLYLANFPGQRASGLSAHATLPGTAESVMSAMRRDLGLGEVGQAVESRGISGILERSVDTDLLLRLTDPVPGYLALFVADMGDGATLAMLQGQLFSDEASAFVEREQPAWQRWLETLAVSTG